MPASNDELPVWKSERLKGGCEKTWREVLDEYNPWIIGLIRRRAHGRDDVVEDVVQETWCEAIRTIDRYEIGTSFGSWLMRIAVNYLRRCSYRPIPTSPPLDNRPEDQFDEADLEMAIHRFAVVQAKLDLLRERDRSMIMLHHLKGMDIELIAQKFRLTPEATRKALKRARGRLRELLEPDCHRLLNHRPQQCPLPIEAPRGHEQRRHDDVDRQSPAE